MSAHKEPIITARKILKYNHNVKTIPESFVITSKKTIFHISQFYKLKRTGHLTWGHIFELNNDGIKIGIAYIKSCGAPELAMTLEELAVLGAKRFILIGAAGALQSHLEAGSIVIPTKAIIEEGTSPHYAKPSKYAVANTALSSIVERSLNENDITYSKGIVWTTDAFYRETKEKVVRYSKEGALCVDMETSALFSVSRYCKTQATALLYITDSLATLEWQPYFGSKVIEKTKLLLAKSAIDSFCTIKNPSFKIRPVRLNMRGLVLSSVIKFAEKCKRLIT